ncbi:butyrophilin-like protein 1 [Spea bombifrons]|uniref:butyrophilin-like protein 1 n=1 Tax=Spea bombifrons TaxID=233779 RepID=UPI00234BB042|nr:butyrophilin-like protein 1 [Spea bombifrons]
MKPLLWINDIIFLLFLLFWAQCEGSVPTVTAVLHGTAILPCSVPFISGTEDLHVAWLKKIGTKPSLVLLAFHKGQFDLTHQAPQYRGRTNMSPDLPNGRLDLTLTHVEHRDEGVYVCHVTNTADYRDIEVGLTVIEKKHRNEHHIVIEQNFLGPEVSQRKGSIEERSAGSGRVCPGPGLVLTIALLVFL